jgi:hypothetical protein
MTSLASPRPSPARNQYVPVWVFDLQDPAVIETFRRRRRLLLGAGGGAALAALVGGLLWATWPTHAPTAPAAAAATARAR